MTPERSPTEEEIWELCRAGETGRAVEGVLRRHGAEIMRLIASVMSHSEQTNDAFGLFCENLLKGLPGFRWESSLRTWAFRVARNACYQLAHAPAARELPVTDSRIPEQPVSPRSDTHPWQRTSVKERFRALRDRLEPEERMLLMLRVDQRLAWTEVARVMWDQDEPPTDAALTREATALRQRFQRIKTHLRTLALQQGLIEPEEQPGG